jgi:hypothetical protein
MRQFITANTETRDFILFWDTLILSAVTTTFYLREVPGELRLGFQPYRNVGEVAAPSRRACSQSTKAVLEVHKVFRKMWDSRSLRRWLKGTVFWNLMLCILSPTFRRNIIPPGSRSKRKPRKQEEQYYCACLLARLVIRFWNWGNTFLRNVDTPLLQYTSSYRRK